MGGRAEERDHALSRAPVDRGDGGAARRLRPGSPRRLRTQILERSEGVPLYAVETVRMLIDRGLLEQVGDELPTHGPIECARGTRDAPGADRRSPGRPGGRGALCGPGRRRARQDLHARPRSRLCRAPATGNLDTLLTALVRKEVLSLQVDPRSPERGQFSFLQDLLRQVAYETLSRRERKARHLAAAAHLEQQWQDGDEELVEIVAAHVLSALELDPEAGDASELREACRGTAAPGGRASGIARAQARTPSATSSKRSSSRRALAAARSSTSGPGSWLDSRAAPTARGPLRTGDRPLRGAAPHPSGRARDRQAGHYQMDPRG